MAGEWSQGVAAEMNRDREPMLYIAQVGAGGPVKIGYSRLPATRIKALEHNSAFPVTLLRVLTGDHLTERAFHRRFRHMKIGGEWFWFNDDMLSYVPSRAEIEDCERPQKEIDMSIIQGRIREIAKTTKRHGKTA